jgi:hypothetical protein
LFNSSIGISFVPAANTSRILGYPDHVVQWDSSQVTMTFVLRIDPRTNRGTYKVVAFIGNPISAFRLGISKGFQIKRPLMKINMPKRNLTQGETVVLNVYNPYFDFNQFSATYSGYHFRIVPWNYPTNGTFETIAELPIMFVRLNPGTYKYALFSYSKYSSTFMYAIPNSTFRVIQNNGIITIDKESYRIGDLMSISLTSTRKVPLSGPFQSWFFPQSNLFPYSKYIPFEESQGAVVINETTTVDWPFPGEYYIKVYLGYSPWAVSKKFKITK